MKIPKKLARMRDEIFPIIKCEHANMIGNHDQNNKLKIEGFNVACAAILESDELKEVISSLDELRDLMDGVRFDGYRPDSLTNQPADNALTKWQEFINDND